MLIEQIIKFQLRGSRHIARMEFLGGKENLLGGKVMYLGRKCIKFC